MLSRSSLIYYIVHIGHLVSIDGRGCGMASKKFGTILSLAFNLQDIIPNNLRGIREGTQPDERGWTCVQRMENCNKIKWRKRDRLHLISTEAQFAEGIPVFEKYLMTVNCIEPFKVAARALPIRTLNFSTTRRNTRGCVPY